MSCRTRVPSLICALALFGVQVASGQVVGDRVLLTSRNLAGVPVHPAAGDATYVRWASGTAGSVRAVDAGTGWLKVEAAGRSGWLTRTYLTVIAPEPQEADSLELPSQVVGTWNLEWLRDGAERGFPEYNQGGPRYGPRTDGDYQAIADVLRRRLGASIMVLTEVGGDAGGHSVELDRLKGFLGGGWGYVLGHTGGQQHVALVYDSAVARPGACREIAVPLEKVDDADVFARDPLVCRFTLLDRHGSPQNDLLVVGLHLASGQEKVRNHNRALAILRDSLHALVGPGGLAPGERDILIGGDLNSSRYDAAVEDYWTQYDSGPGGLKLVTLSPVEGDDYTATRLAGVPLFPRSKIDYLIASGGLAEEMVQLVAQVHDELLATDFDQFRAHYSDHLPVTVRVRVVPDADP